MTQPNSQTLTQAFEHTHYSVQANGAWHRLTIGATIPPAFHKWLKTHCHGRCAWIITAHNPQATVVADDTNAQRDAALRVWLDTHAFAYTLARNCAPDGSWPAEPGACLLDTNEGQARALALRLDQAAFVAVPVDGEPQLAWTDP